MEIDLDTLYAVLAPVARREGGSRGQIFYGELSQAYFERNGEWHEPHGSWDRPLGRLNQTLHPLGWPALSAVVVNQDTGEPGGGFWGWQQVPPRPSNDVARIALYAQILAQVHAADWPATMPLSPPA